jgi:hypothetical protein
MECPKCRAHNSEEAVCCSLCFHAFKGRPAPSAAAQSAGPSQSFRPAGDVTVNYYWTVNLTRGSYLALQGAIFLFVILVLISMYTMTDADIVAKFPPNPPPELTAAKVRSSVKLLFWFGLAWESVATWYFLSLFSKKERGEG